MSDVDVEHAVEGFDQAELGQLNYEAPLVERGRAYLPWHRPRKQYVRRMWKGVVADVMKTREAEADIRYLGLPGVDLLDLRFLYNELCRDKARGLRFLGFDFAANGGDSTPLQLSLQDLKLAPGVHAGSTVLGDNIRRLAAIDSQPFAVCKRHAPFDVINLDLCDNILADDPTSADSLYRAIRNLLALQGANTMERWVLLVTTSMTRNGANADAVELLYKGFCDAAVKCEAIQEVADLFFSVPIDELDPMGCTDDEFVHMVTLGLVYWLFTTARAARPAKLSLRASFAYRNYATAVSPDMVSIAVQFQFLFDAPHDVLGLAGDGHEAPMASDCDVLLSIMTKHVERKDVDVASEGLLEELISESAVLMAEARYADQEYRDWARTQS